ncbi:hypothetical protein R6Q57_011418 [Mikania cordata]
MVHISDELIVFEILTRVPARTVARSKCVSKKWKALLLTSQFVKIHCSRSLSASDQKVVLVDDLTYSTHTINFQSDGHEPGTILYFPFNKVTIYSHLDGLLCVLLNHTSELALWNPVTGNRIQPRTLLPQFRNVFNQPTVRDDNIQSHRLLNEATTAVAQEENVEDGPYNFVYDVL